MSNTPETDREEIVMGRTECDRYVLAEFSRRLERERDAALMDRANGDMATMTINHYERLIKERDEAIRQRNETNESSKYAVDYAIRERDEAITARKVSVAQLMEQISKAEKRVKEAQEIAARALIERDEILKSLEK